MVDKLKAKRIAKRIMDGEPITEALRNEDYSESTSKQGRRNPIVQEAEIQINTDMLKQGVSLESVDRDLTEDRELARKKNDIATMVRVDELKGKLIGAFTDNIQTEQTILTQEGEKGLYHYIRNNPESILNFLQTNRLLPQDIVFKGL